MSESILREKAKDFAKNIVFITKEIKSSNKESVLTNQLLRSGTSIGANIHEAQYAQGTADFISKLEIALKECFESEYWLELLFETGYLEETQYKKLNNDCLIVFGSRDKQTPLSYAKRMKKLIKNSRLVVLNGLGHFCFSEDPDGFNGVVFGFLSECNNLGCK